MSAARPPQSRKPNAGLRRQIDENLKRLYDDTLEEEVPDRFAELIAKLKSAEGGDANDPEQR